MSRRRDRRKKRRRRQVMMSLASMGDIAFLLIIFFVLVSNFAKDKAVQLTPPKAQEIDTLSRADLTVQIDEEGLIYLDDGRVDTAKDLEMLIAAELQDFKEPEDRRVNLKIHNQTPLSVYEPVIEAIQNGNGVINAQGEKPQ